MGIIISAWHNDLLERKTDANYLYRLIKGRAAQHKTAGSIVINVDARWGQGKSYFIDNMYLDVIKKRHPAITIDAWKYDYVDDPYTYVMAELDEYFETLIARNKRKKTGKEKILEKVDAIRANAGKLLWVGLKGAAKRAGRFVVAEGADEMMEVVEQYAPTSLLKEAKGAVEDVENKIVQVSDTIISAYIKKRLDDFSETKESLENFRVNLASLIDLLHTEYGMQLPMYIFVDELDRCRPTYAIQMLERIKHLFDIPNLAFVVATDTTSLSHSIKAVYGSEFDSKQYLQRFFHRTYKLPIASREKIIAALIMRNGTSLDLWRSPDDNQNINSYASFFDITSRKFGLTVRQAEQSIHILNDITNAADTQFKLEITYLYCLICEFISEGDLERSNFSRLQDKIKRFGSEWTIDNGGGDLSYYGIVSSLHEISKTTIFKALKSSQAQKNSNYSPLNEYIYITLKPEYEIKRQMNRDDIVELSTYYDLINRAKNSYMEDDEDEYTESDPEHFEKFR